LIVDYGARNQACTLKVAALMPANEKVYRTSGQEQQMYDFLLGNNTITVTFESNDCQTPPTE
jgi:hypothetical protein